MAKTHEQLLEENLKLKRFVHDIKMECYSCEDYNMETDEGYCPDDCHSHLARVLLDELKGGE